MKKLSRSLMACSVLVMLAVFMSSCKQDLTVQPTPSVEQVTNDKIETLDLTGVQVKGGVLHFESGDVFSKVDAAFSKASPQSRSESLKKIGFKSMNDYYSDFENALNNAKTLEEENQIIVSYSDFVKLEAELFKIKPYLISKAHFMDRRGVFSIGNYYYKCHDKGEFITQKISDIEIFEKTGQVVVNSSNINFKADIEPRSWCSGLSTATTSSSDRRVDIFTTPQQFLFDVDAVNVRYTAEIYTKATPYKKNWRDRWVTYRTVNHLSVNYDRQLSSAFNQLTPENKSFSYSNDWDAIDYGDKLINYVVMTRQQANNQMPLISKITANTASTQGNVAATITCH
jgi:hypothetical protein